MKPPPRSPGVDTAEGFIPHREIFTDVGIIQAPVRIETRRTTEGREAVTRIVDGMTLPVPARDENGNLLFALPGGYSII